MAREKAEPARKKRARKTLVRGADGGLYVLTDNALAPFRLSEENTEKVTQILKDAHENLVVAKLSSRVIHEMDFSKSVSSASSSEIFINTIRKK
jgi:hypothetical protein